MDLRFVGWQWEEFFIAKLDTGRIESSSPPLRVNLLTTLLDNNDTSGNFALQIRWQIQSISITFITCRNVINGNSWCQICLSIQRTNGQSIMPIKILHCNSISILNGLLRNGLKKKKLKNVPTSNIKFNRISQLTVKCPSTPRTDSPNDFKLCCKPSECMSILSMTFSFSNKF